MSRTVEWVAMKSGTDTRGHWRMCHKHFGEPPDIYYDAASRSNVSVFQSKWSHRNWGTGTNSCTDVNVGWMMYCNESGDPLTLPLAPPWGSQLWLWVNCLSNYWMDCCLVQTFMCPSGFIVTTYWSLNFSSGAIIRFLICPVRCFENTWKINDIPSSSEVLCVVR